MIDQCLKCRVHKFESEHQRATHRDDGPPEQRRSEDDQRDDGRDCQPDLCTKTSLARECRGNAVERDDDADAQREILES